MRGIPNIVGITDDILVFGSLVIKHLSSIHQHVGDMYEEQYCPQLAKAEVKQEKINFYGHNFVEKGIQPAEEKLQGIKNTKVPANR